jgi:hemerythrin-like domain-containing protein
MAKEIFRRYLPDLRNHIGAENNELFITAEQMLSDDEKATLYFSFLYKDSELGEDRKKEFENKILNKP